MSNKHTYNIVFVTGHNSGAWLFKDNELIHAIEEERLSRIKGDGTPIKCAEEMFKFIHKERKVNNSNNSDVYVNIYEYSMFKDRQHILYHSSLNFHKEDMSLYQLIAEKNNIKKENITYKFLYKEHHLYHALGAFVQSNFDESVNIVLDGNGSLFDKDTLDESFKDEIKDIPDNDYLKSLRESFSVYYTKKDEENIIKVPIIKEYNSKLVKNNLTFNKNNIKYILTNNISIGTMYSVFTKPIFQHFKKDKGSTGKLMGLAQYGNINVFKDILSKKMFNANYMKSIVYEYGNKYKLYNDDLNNPSKESKDLAFTAQEFYETRLFDYIDECIKECKKRNIHTRNISITGGSALNIVANYKLLDRYKDYKFFFDPVGYDFGIGFGIAVDELQAKRYNTLYHGFEYENYSKYGYDEKEVISSLLNKEIVAIHQGKSEIGPRALGNRSLLLDPRLDSGADIMNTIKNREKFRPFACICLEEDAKEWFDLRGYHIKDMMVAVKVKKEKQKIVPAIVHVDGTCRAQSINENDNPVLYKLLKEWKKHTGVPMLMNTSFNLAGEPIVETIDDAIRTYKNSNISKLVVV